VSVSGGETTTFNASVINKNAQNIELVDLVVKFPEGTKDPKNPTKDISQNRLSLGNINSGQVVQKSLSAILYGQEGDTQNISFSVEYRTANSNAIFRKEKTYTLTIGSSPILVSIDSLDKVLSNQPTDVSVSVISNSPVPIRDVLLSLEYPFGFQIIPGEIKPTYGNNVWRIGDIAPGSRKTITFKAILTGEDGEDRVIHANVGIMDASNENLIGTTIVSRERTLTLERPSLGIDVSLNGETSKDLVTEPGENVRTDIIWKNNSSTRINNARIEVNLSGNALDRNSISVNNGYYDSSRDTIVWEAGRVSGLASIAPGESNRVSFSFSSRKSVPGQTLSNPTVKIEVSAKGNRTDELGVSQEVTTGTSRSVKLVSNLGINSRALYSQGAFINSGPLPPKVDKETTYTIVWTVSNTSNIVGNTQVIGVLPQNVTWLGHWAPAGANLSYNSVGGQVTWLAGDIPANGGSKEVSFQVSLKPSLTQAGRAANLLGQTTVTGTDSFTGVIVRSNASALTTRITTDLYWKSGDDTVTE